MSKDLGSLLAHAVRECLTDDEPDPVDLLRARRHCIAAITTVALSAALEERGLTKREARVADAAALLDETVGRSWLTRLHPHAADAYAVVDRCSDEIAEWAASVPRIGDIYDRLARLEVRSVKGRVETLGTTDHRVRSAYYTPSELASEACEVLSLAPGTSVADLSCGTGAFLVAALAHVKDPMLLHGVDVDPLAVAVARIEIAVAAGELGVARDLDKNFTVGNPLLPAALASDDDRCQLFDAGFVYHQDQGVTTPFFDAIVGNPPWHRIRLEERRFFRPFASEVVSATRKRDRTAAIEALKQTAPPVFQYYQAHVHTIDRARKLIVSDPRLAMTAQGELNSYALFAELAAHTGAIVGLLVKSALFTTRANAAFLHRLLDDGRLRAVYDFVNTGRVFDIDSRERFSFMVAGPPRPPGNIHFASGLRRPEELRTAEAVVLSSEELWRMNGVTGVLPNTSNRADLDLLRVMSYGNAAFDDEYPDAHFGRLVHLTAHATYIHADPGFDRLPVYEGKFIEQYDGRFATFARVPSAERYTAKARAAPVSDEQRSDISFEPQARYFIERSFWRTLTRRHDADWSLMWRNTTSATNRRTVLATVLPHLPTTQSVQLLQLGNGRERDLALLLVVMNSAVYDFAVRQRLNGIDVTSTVVRQVPVPPREHWKEDIPIGSGRGGVLGDYVLRRAAALLASDARLMCFTAAIQPDVTAANLDERRRLQLEIDAAVALAYGLDEAQVSRVMETLPRDFSVADKEYVLAHLAKFRR